MIYNQSSLNTIQQIITTEKSIIDIALLLVHMSTLKVQHEVCKSKRGINKLQINLARLKI